jgi:hypothetical protein
MLLLLLLLGVLLLLLGRVRLQQGLHWGLQLLLREKQQHLVQLLLQRGQLQLLHLLLLREQQCHLAPLCWEARSREVE